MRWEEIDFDYGVVDGSDDPNCGSVLVDRLLPGILDNDDVGGVGSVDVTVSVKLPPKFAFCPP